jgi:hypothetical protein
MLSERFPPAGSEYEGMGWVTSAHALAFRSLLLLQLPKLEAMQHQPKREKGPGRG